MLLVEGQTIIFFNFQSIKKLKHYRNYNNESIRNRKYDIDICFNKNLSSLLNDSKITKFLVFFKHIAID